MGGVLKFKLFEKIKSSFTNKSSLKSNKLFVFILIGLILIIFLSCFISPSSKKTTKTTNNFQSNNLAEEYCKSLENRLINVLESVKGVGSVKVLIMVDSSPQVKYLEETTKTTSNSDLKTGADKIETTIVLCKDGTLTYPIVVVETLPKITGVLIVASGVSDIKMKTTLINVTSSVLSVDVSNVEVLEGKK